MAGQRVTYKCRWCGYQTPAWRTLKDGTRRNGYAQLESHVEDAHRDRYAEHIARVLDDEASDPETLEE